MITVRDLLANKPAGVVTTSPRTSVYDALASMAEHDVGALPVLERGKIVGLLSERDYARGVVLRGRTSRETAVAELMTKPVLVRLCDSIEHCMTLMTVERVRHLPVVEAGELIGIVTIGDVVKQIIQEQAFQIDQLENYIRGV
ncbi:MAG: CBS domain-containing protein [Planctomycetes bacterium]|nr:CBS domain-containing protein [Planctomycetota bacterium]